MISWFNKLKQEKLLKSEGTLLDLGCGNGRMSEAFFQHGYDVTLVDFSTEALAQAEKNFKTIKSDGFEIVNSPIEKFQFDKSYDGVLLLNVLPFQKEKSEIERIVNTAFEKLAPGGFLAFSLFGTKDQWATESREGMSFYTKEEALGILKQGPYFVSEDYGQGMTMKGDIKTWHVFHFLYLK